MGIFKFCLLFAVGLRCGECMELPTPIVEVMPGGDFNRIVSGQEARIEDHAHQISFVVNNTWFCGGSIISEVFIMTAAHCVVGADPETVVLRAGSTYRHEGGVILPVAEIKWHPNYNDPAFDSDIAVMKLKDSIEFSDVMSAVPLPEDNEHIPYNSKVSVSGWGRTKQGAGSIPKHLMAVEIPYQTSTLCQLSYPTVYTDNMFCAGPYVIGGKGTCQGDSGGAALINGKAFGIVSFGRGCAQPLSPSAFANVASLRQWLREQTSL